MTDVPAYVRNGRRHPLGEPARVRALPVFTDPAGRRTWRVLLSQLATEFFDGWEAIADDAILRAQAGRDPYDRQLSDLIGELSTVSEEFRVRWADHNVKFHRSGVKQLHHPLIGDLTLAYEALELPGDTGQRILAQQLEVDALITQPVGRYPQEQRPHSQPKARADHEWALGHCPVRASIGPGDEQASTAPR